MNKKGFTLVELLVSMVLIFAISIALFRTVVSIQGKQVIMINKNKFLAFESVLVNSIGEDFKNYKISSTSTCGDNCYKIKFNGKGEVTISIDKTNNSLTYNGVISELPSGYAFYDDLSLINYSASNEGVNSFILVNIPIKENNTSKLVDLKYMYQYDNSIDNVS